MYARPCRRCTTPTRHRSRLCPACRRTHDHDRNNRRTHYAGTYPARRAQLRHEAEQANAPCWICGQPIAYHHDNPHPDSFTADHVTPSDPASELRPAHLRCNSARGATPIDDDDRLG